MGQRFRVVEVDSLDVSDESWVGPSLASQEIANRVAACFNEEITSDSMRFYKVVVLPYKLEHTK